MVFGKFAVNVPVPSNPITHSSPPPAEPKISSDPIRSDSISSPTDLNNDSGSQIPKLKQNSDLDRSRLLDNFISSNPGTGKSGERSIYSWTI